MSNGHAQESRAATIIRRLAVPIILFWVVIAAVTNATVPQLEVVGEERSAPLNAADAPSTMAMRHIGKVFNEFDSDSSAMVVLEGDKPLGAQAHEFYNTLVQRLNDDREHVQHVADYWGDPITAGGSQSKDGKAAYVQVYVAGNQGEALSNQSVDAVRRIVADTPAPDGVKAYVSGEAPTITDQFEVGNAGSAQVTLITFAVIAIMLLIVYRSLTTTALVLVTVLVELSAARGIVAALAHTGVIGLSTYATNLLTMLAIAAGTDYAIFFVGRYQEARSAGEDRLAAYQTMFKSTAHVIIGSGLTVAGALLCLSFTRLPYFQTLGVPAALGVLVTLAAALTMAPAVLVIGSRFGLMEPKRAMRTRGWRRIGTAIVRWPGPILVVSCVVTLIGVLALPGYKTTYDGRIYMPESTPSNVGYAAAERHFSVARLNPELLMIETDFDMRNPAGMVLLERVAKSVLHARGVALVQSITRPLGTPITHSSIPFQISASSASQLMNLSQQQNQALYLSQQADQMTQTIAVLKNQLALQKQSAAITHEQTQGFQQTVAVAQDLRDKIANFDDQFRPIRNYFYWEPHCFDIPFCAALRSLFDALDGIDELVDALQTVTGSLTKLDALQPKLVDLIPPQISIQEKNRDLTQSNYAINNGTNTQNEESTRTATELGKAFDDAKNDDSFYLPPEAFDNPAFKRGMKLFMSPDGKAARMIITHQGDPQTSEGIEHINAIKEAAFDAVKATPLADAKIYVAGTASAYKDIADGQKYDLLMAALASLGLILLIMMFLTRSIVAALVIVGTVALSLAASFGMSVVVWQYIFGIPLYWVIFPLAVIILLAVGADYNLLLISRFKEETGAGLKTGIIRAIAGTGGVVTAAGLVFAVTMSSFIFSDLRVLGQIGTTIGLGLLFDTLVVRSFLTPAIATLLGRWFWWPLNVRSRPLPKPFGPKPVGTDDATGPIPAGG